MAKPLTTATCHPEKLNHAKGLCAACYTRQRLHANPSAAQAHRDANKRYRLTHPNYKEHRRGVERRRRYGLSKADFDKLMKQAGYRCEICREPAAKLCIDHDHLTGQVRGILCDRCNKALGAYEYMLNFEPGLSNYLGQSCSGWFRTLKCEKGSTEYRVL